jgi:LysM repeat protein
MPTPDSVPYSIDYMVQANDTVSKIDDRFGVTTDQRIEANGLENPNEIDQGQNLLIPVISRWWIEEVPQSLTFPDFWFPKFDEEKADLRPGLFGWGSGYGDLSDLMDKATDPFVQEFSRLNNLDIQKNNQGDEPLFIFVKGKSYTLPAGYLVPIGDANLVLKNLKTLEDKGENASQEEENRRGQIRKALLHVDSSDDPYKDTPGRLQIREYLYPSK